jgi:hypothetical protein
MQHRFTSAVFGALFLASGLFLIPLIASAQATEGVQIKPAIVEDKAKPGDTFQFTLTVTNIAPVAKTFYLSAQDIKSVDEQGIPVFSSDDQVTQYSLSTWIALPQSSIQLAAGEAKTIPFTVHVPAGAGPGSHYGGVFLDARPPKEQATGAAVGMKVGSIVSIRIAGDIAEEARLREFSTDKLIYGEPTVAFHSKVENLGNVLVRPLGLIEVTNMFGKKIATMRVNDSGASVFPTQERVYTNDWAYEDFAFGRYQAVVSLVYGDEARKTISGTTSFWVLPFKPIMIILGSVLGVALVLFFLIRSYIMRKLRQMGVSPKNQAVGSYNNGYQRSASRLLFTIVGIVFFTALFIFVLFLMFA